MEYFDVCDEHGSPTGETVSREYAHENDILHRTAHIWITRPTAKGADVLLQKRSDVKDSFPGCLDTSSAGHIRAGDEPLISALRELGEELGITASPEELKFIGNCRIHYAKEFRGRMFRDNEIAFLYIYEGSVDETALTLQKEEVSAVEWHDINETISCINARDARFCVPLNTITMLKNSLNI